MGTLMIFFVAMPFRPSGLIEHCHPVCSSAYATVAIFRTLNSISFLADGDGRAADQRFAGGGASFARTGWLPYPPLSELRYSPGVGV